MQDLNIKKISDAVAKVTAESLADKVFEEEVTKIVEKTDSCKFQGAGLDEFSRGIAQLTELGVQPVSVLPAFPDTYMTGVLEANAQMGVVAADTIQSLASYGRGVESYPGVSQLVSSMGMRLSEIIIDEMINSISLMTKYYIAETKEIIDQTHFMRIADELKFPIYLENGGELQELLVDSYRKNGRKCDKDEMTRIIMDYFNDDYALRVFNSIKSVGIFEKYNAGRMSCLIEGFELYEEGRYVGAGSTFVLQLSGMITDVYEEMRTFHTYTRKEKKNLIDAYGQECSINSEKSKLLQIVSCQDNGFSIWQKIAKHFLNVVYSTEDAYVESNPQRHPMCHGEQTNYGTQEMNLKLIMCMDILAELAWSIQEMKEEKKSA